MKFDEKALRLYLVTDRAWTKGQSLKEQVAAAIRGGGGFVQLREKSLSDEDILDEALEIQSLCRENGVPFVINDRVRLAMKINADGVHVGQEDMRAGEVRRLFGEDKILGVSVQTVEQAVSAEAEGADYLGVGAVFSTSSKADAEEVSLDTLRKICAVVTIPVVAIGGINKENIILLKNSGISGVAVISAVFAKADIERAARELSDISRTIITKEQGERT